MKKDWRYYFGLVFLIFSIILPLFSIAIPFLPIDIALKATFIAILSVGGPELMIVLAVLCLGKKYITYFKEKIYGFFRLKKIPKPVSKTRYYFGLFCFIFSVVPLYIAAYFPEILPHDELEKHLITATGDLVFVLSFFILGANFWEKFKRLFVWDGPG